MFLLVGDKKGKIHDWYSSLSFVDLDERILKQQQEEEERKRQRRERKKEKKVSSTYMAHYHYQVLQCYISFRCIFILTYYCMMWIVYLLSGSEREGSGRGTWARPWCCRYDGIWGFRLIQKVIRLDNPSFIRRAWLANLCSEAIVDNILKKWGSLCKLPIERVTA